MKSSTLNQLCARYSDQVLEETRSTWLNGRYWEPITEGGDSDAFFAHESKVRSKVHGRARKVFVRLMNLSINSEIGRF